MSKFSLPYFFSPIGLAVAKSAQGNKIHRIVMGFVVVNMVNVKSCGITLMNAAILTSEAVSFSYLVSQGRAKLFGIANIKAVLSFAGKGNAIRTIHSIVSTLYKANSFRDRIAATVTRDGYGIVMPIVFTLSASYFGRVFTFAFMVTKVLVDSAYSCFLSFDFFSAIIAMKRYFKGLGPMPCQKLPSPTSFIVHIKGMAASAFAVYKFISGRMRLVSGYI